MWLPQMTTAVDWSSEREGKTVLLRWRTYAANDPQLIVAQNQADRPSEVPGLSGELDEAGLRELRKRVLWTYPFPAATVEPAVKRVSTLIWEQSESGSDEQSFFGPNASVGFRSQAGGRKRNAQAIKEEGKRVTFPLASRTNPLTAL